MNIWFDERMSVAKGTMDLSEIVIAKVNSLLHHTLDFVRIIENADDILPHDINWGLALRVSCNQMPKNVPRRHANA